MADRYIKGQIVIAHCYGGEKVLRRVAKDLGSTVVICCDEEYLRAQEEGREPDGIGFPDWDISVPPLAPELASAQQKAPTNAKKKTGEQ